MSVFFTVFNFRYNGSEVALQYYNRRSMKIQKRRRSTSLCTLCPVTVGRVRIVRIALVFLHSLHLHTLISEFEWISRRSVRILIKSLTFECENGGENISHNTPSDIRAQKIKKKIKKCFHVVVGGGDDVGGHDYDVSQWRSRTFNSTKIRCDLI